ncbi:hypothetical protein [Alkaliphilus peptidifermentans]|uniref:Uncharacterized protein n=1 Tax=Alkaliphilus peptidifermentans DSM 18978 TaxID=1120976 RepID=A0A1G5GAY4_9FIRM|nr:hypothetical protein [Alkaliphilus peptidifermentans]SCY48715.1 hypothetical protein SAMN03080606_01626 [Alkaliphilus peptidifermentans DSM 18978]
MKRFFIGITVIVILFAVWIVIGQSNSKAKVTAQYRDGRITTQVKTTGIHNIASTIFRYKTHFLDQYINVDPWVVTYTFPNRDETHIYEVPADLFGGKKDDLEVEVAVTYQDGTEEILGNVILKDMKKQVYDDFVLEPEFEEGFVYYHANGLTAVIAQNAYDEDIIFYSYPNSSSLSVGFQKYYALYPLKNYGVISEEALSEDFLGFEPVNAFINVSGEEMYIVVEHSMIDLRWDGFYPYDSEGNEVIYEGKAGENINLVRNGELVDISKASHEKYRQMVSRIPDIRFLITSLYEWKGTKGQKPSMSSTINLSFFK